MAGRPANAVGTYGNIHTFKEANGTWSARTRFRDSDGETRPVERTRETKNAAVVALKEALRDRVRAAGGGDITPDSRAKDLIAAWWAEFERKERSPLTVERYRDRLDKQIIPGLGALRVREWTTGAMTRFLSAVETKHGRAIAKMTRSVLSGVCRYACQHDALDRNPVRETSAISVKPKKAPHALALAATRQLIAFLSYDLKAVSRDLIALVQVMAATGIRVGEVLALRWDSLDFAAGTLEVNGTVIRMRGKGLVIKQPKTRAGLRTLELSDWCLRMLAERKLAAAAPPEGRTITVLLPDGSFEQVALTDANMPIFPSEVMTLRDPSNVDHQFKEAFLAAGEDEITSHTLRKTVATAMDEAGLSPRAAADQLGHEQVSFTQDTYYGRKVGKTGAAAVLEALDHGRDDGPAPQRAEAA